MKLTIDLTEEQAAAIESEIQGYAEALANDRIIRAADRVVSAKLNQFKALPDAAKNKALAAAYSTVPNEKPLEE